jgi:two-component system, chemotaxis family, protein-glutamate methylesterase/glutaminase
MIKVLVADSSVTDRDALVKLLRLDPEIEVIGEASHGAQAMEMVKRLRPHIVVMGVYLSASGGFRTTSEMMIEAPTPIVIVSDERDARQVEMSILALSDGALSIVSMPSPHMPEVAGSAGERLIASVRAMSQVKVVRRWRERSRPGTAMPRSAASTEARIRIVAMAASTGGPAALQQIISELPADFCLPILVVQHIGSGFVDGLVHWLNSVCSLNVKPATDGELLSPHTVYIAPDDNHLFRPPRRSVDFALQQRFCLNRLRGRLERQQPTSFSPAWGTMAFPAFRLLASSRERSLLKTRPVQSSSECPAQPSTRD